MPVPVPKPALELDALTERFGDVVAVDDLTLTVEQGEIFGFLGPNGAGKSTTIRMLLNLLRPDARSARIMGVPSTDVATAHRHLAYVPGDAAPRRRVPLLSLIRCYVGRFV